MTDFRHDRYCDAVEAEEERLLELVRRAGPKAPVPSCPGWATADLVEHHGRTHRWMEYLVRHRATERVWSRDVPLGLPEDVAEYPRWLAESVEASLRTLRAADPEMAVWSHGPDHRARFFPRRLLFEAVIHRADAELALGVEPFVDAEVGADGLDELLELLASFPEIGERAGALGRPGDTVCLASAEGPRWRVTLGGEGFAWERGAGGADGTVTARGTCGDLLLLAYGRLRPGDGRLAISGDGGLLAGWLEATAL